MLLAIDVGNTHTVFGLYEGAALRRHWRFESNRGRTADEYGVLMRPLLANGEARVTAAVVSSVVPPLTDRKSVV